MGVKMAYGNHTKYGTRNTRSKTKRVLLRMAYFVVLLAMAVMYSNYVKPALSVGEADSPFRRLLSANGTVHDPCDEMINKPDTFDKETPELAIVCYILGILYVFLGVAVVCDDHFCVALEVICDVLDLDEAVAGATFMAAGSSAPELATSLVTVFTTKDGTGLGTILGSAVFNLVMIVCLSGMFGNGPEYKLRFDKDGKRYLSSPACTDVAHTFEKDENGKFKNPGLFLDWRPLARDSAFYVVSIVICVIFALTDVGGAECNGEGAAKSCGWCEGVPPSLTFAAGNTGGNNPNKKNCEMYNGQPGYNWWEGLILTLCYGIYIQSMIKNEELMDWMAGEKAAGNKAPTGMYPHIWGFIMAKQVAEEREEQLQQQQELTDTGVEHLVEGEQEKQGLLSNNGIGERPTMEPEKPHTQADAASVTETQEDARDIESLRKRIDQLEARVYHSRQMVALFETISDTKYMYKLSEEQPDGVAAPDQEEDGGCIDKIMGLCAWPWNKAFVFTIPPCDRDSYQVWPTDNVIAFHQIPEESQALIKREREMKGLDEEGEESAIVEETIFIKGKYTRKKVLIWYNRSKVYLVSFFMSIIWIAVTSWLMVVFASQLGCHFGVGPFLMGLVVLAAGTSIPDALSSVVVAQEGDGDMAVANAIGSNVFNIFLGIGLPMMFSEWVSDAEGMYQPYLVTDTLAVLTTSVLLIVITFIMYFALVCNKWILTPKLSGILMTMFFFYIGVGVLLDSGVLPFYKSMCTMDLNDGMNGTKPSTFSCEGNCPGFVNHQTNVNFDAKCNWEGVK